LNKLYYEKYLSMHFFWINDKVIYDDSTSSETKWQKENIEHFKEIMYYD